MSKTPAGLAAYVQTKLGTPYVYAAKMETVTQAKINSWADQYPSVFSSSYIAKANKYIGKVAADCSGLICAYTGVTRGSANMKSNATYCIGISGLNESHIGYILWRSGHVGVYIGNGYCVEARGIDYGTVKSKVSSRSFTHVILIPELSGGTATTTDTSTGSTSTASTSTSGSSSIKSVQTWLNSYCSAGLTVDGKYGPLTKKAHIKALQTYLNSAYKAGLVVDGVFGPKTKAAIRVLKKGSTGTYVKILQGFLICNGYDTGGFDGDFGSKTDTAVRSYQGSKGLTVDGQAGKNTFAKLCA